MSSEVRALLDLPMLNYEQWEQFDRKLNELVQRELLKPIAPLRCIHGRSESWYRDPDDDEVYVYLPVDDKILPVWERVDVFAQPPKPDDSRDLWVNGLSLFKTGPISKAIAWFARKTVESFAQEGRVEILDAPNLPNELWCREYSTAQFYRLIEDHVKNEYRWECVSESEWKSLSTLTN